MSQTTYSETNQAALKETYELFRLMLDNMPNSSVTMFDLDMRYTLAGGPFLQSLGMTPDQIIGKRPQDILSPEALAFIEPIFRRALNGESFNYDRSTPEYDYEAHITPLRNADDRIIGGMILSHDTTRIRRSVDALQRSEEQFRATFDYAAIGIALVGLDGHWLQVNPAVCQLLGYTEAELLTKTFQEITHPDDLHSDLYYVERLLDGEIESYEIEKRYFHKQGHEVWVLLSVSLVRDNKGQPLQFVKQIQNITERKLAEQALTKKLEEEHEFQTYLEALHEISIELTHINHLDDFYKRAVEFGLEHFGFDRIGLLLYDTENALVKGTYGTDAQGNLVDEHHISLNPANLTGILSRAFKSHTRFELDREADLFSNFQPIGKGWNAVAVLSNGVERLGWLAIDNGAKHLPISKPVLDILELYALTLGTLLKQKRTQNSLVEQRNLLRTLIDNIPDYIFLMDAQGRFILANSALAQTSGNSTPKDMIGKTAFDIFPPELAHRFHKDEQALFQSGESLINAERDTIDAQGNSKTVLTTKIPWRDSKGQILGLVGISRDITDRKHLEALLLEQEKLQTAFDKERELSQLKSRMMERIGHEFRTPLAIIQLTSDTLARYLDRLTLEQRLTKNQMIKKTVQRITDMLDEIGIVVGDKLSPRSIMKTSLHLKPLCEQIAAELEPQFELPGKYVVNLPDDMTATADSNVLKLGLFHIMRNAARFSPPHSPVVITATRNENQLELSITDSGIGILPDEQPRIFDPFFRGSNLNEVGGLGLGLTIAHDAIEAHKGEITFESVPQQGTTVRITLPA